MRVDIRDRDALQAISPDALSAYAKAAGWSKIGSYREYSDVYDAEHLPEIILPRTQQLADYASVVGRLIAIFAEVAGRDELALYRDLVNANRDVVRVRAGGGDEGSLTVNDGVELVGGSRDMLLAAACSLREPQALYRAGTNKEASELLSRVRLGQTEQGSFVVALSIQIVPGADEAPIERRMTQRLVEALRAVHRALEGEVVDYGRAFARSVDKGISANLCDALDRMISPFPKLDVSMTWARTLPVSRERPVVRFTNSDARILREAAQSLRKAPTQSAARLVGTVYDLRRHVGYGDGIARMWANVDGKRRAVKVYARRAEYERLTDAHRRQSDVIVEGDLEYGQRLSLRNADIVAVEPNENNG